MHVCLDWVELDRSPHYTTLTNGVFRFAAELAEASSAPDVECCNLACWHNLKGKANQYPQAVALTHDIGLLLIGNAAGLSCNDEIEWSPLTGSLVSARDTSSSSCISAES